MYLAIQLASKDKIFRDETIQDLSYFNSHSLLTEAIGGEKLIGVFRAVEKGFYLLEDKIMHSATESNSLEVKKSYFDQKCLEKSKKTYNK